MKAVYLYDYKTNEFTGKHECQLNTINNKDYDVPWNSLSTAPPKLKKNEVAVANQDTQAWDIQADFRGEKAYNTESGQEVEIAELGELPKNLTLTPRPSEYHTFKSGKWTLTKDGVARKKNDEAKAHNQKIYAQIDALELKQNRPIREKELAKYADDEKAEKAALDRIKQLDTDIQALRATLRSTQ